MSKQPAPCLCRELSSLDDPIRKLKPWQCNLSFSLNTAHFLCPSVDLMGRQLYEGLSVNILNVKGHEILFFCDKESSGSSVLIINREENSNPNIITALKRYPSASLMSSVELGS